MQSWGWLLLLKLTCSPLPREGAPQGASQPGPGLAGPLRSCSQHRKPPCSAATSRSPCGTPAGAAATTCRWGAGWDGVGEGQVAARGSCTPRPSTATWGFPAQPPASARQGPLPAPAGRTLTSSHGDVLERLAGSWRGLWSPQPLPHTLPHRSGAPFFSSCPQRLPSWMTVSVACPEVSHTPGGTTRCQGPRGSQQGGRSQQPRLHHDLVWGKGQLSRPMSCNLERDSSLDSLADFC